MLIHKVRQVCLVCSRTFSMSSQASTCRDQPGSDLHWTNLENHQKFGNVYREKMGPDVEIVFISDPNLCERVLRSEGIHPVHLVPRAWQVYNDLNGLKRGLFFAEGEEWARMRKPLQRILSAKQEFNSKATENLLTTLPHNTGEWQQIDSLEDKLSLWSMESVLWNVFGSQFQADRDQIQTLVTSVQGIFKASAQLQFKSAEMESQSNSDLWQFFSLQIKTAMEAARILSEGNLSRCQDGMALEMKPYFKECDFQAILSDLILAAADTTSITALWTLHSLSLDATHQQAIRRKGANYAKWCLFEAMRLYPVAPFITRILPCDFDLGPDLGIIPKGQLILLSTFAMGRNEAFYPKANVFWPERWRRKDDDRGERIGAFRPFAFLPFGTGRRDCVGKALATAQIIDLVTRLTANYQLRSENETEVKMIMRYTGVPDQKILIGYQRI